LTCRKSWYSLIRGRKSLIYSSDPADSESCRRPSKGVEGVLYGGKLFMKKKLVSILLSLSMCTAYAMPLTAVAEAPAEEPTVVETEAPNANTKEFKFVGTPTGAKLEVQYGDTISLAGVGAWAVGGTSAGGVNVTGFSEKVLVNSQDNASKFSKGVEYTLDSKSSKFASIENGVLKAEGVNKTATVNVTVKTGGELEATGTLSVSLKPKDISNVANGVVSSGLIKVLYPQATGNDLKASKLATVDFETELGSGKKYASLDDVVKKFKGKKGVTFKIQNLTDGMFRKGLPQQLGTETDVELKANQDYTVTAEIGLVGDTNKKYNNYTVNEPVEVGGKKYNCYVKTGSAASGGYAEKNSVTNKYPVQDDVTIIIQGKKNYTGTFVVTGCKVKNLETQRIYAKTGTGLLAGSTVKFGEAEDILSGIYFDNDTTAQDAAVLKDAVKLKALTKNIKIDGKTNKVTVKSVANTAKDNVAKISVTSKKNKNAATEIEFTVTAKSISTQGFDFTDTKAVGTTDKKKYYKTLAEFEKKFGANGKGLDLSWKDISSGKEKVVKLKAGKDYNIAVTKAGIQILDKNGKGTGVYTDKATKKKISNELIYTVTGSGNYKGSVTGSIVVPLEPQLITGAAVASGKSVTFGSVEANIFDYVFVDEDGLKTTGSTGIKGNADVIKNFKVKGDKNVKIDKEGNITVKNVDKNGTKITVTSKKNKAAECEYKFKLAEANLSKISPKFDEAAFSGKTYADASKAQEALKKIKVSVGEKTKLKADKDYTVKLANGSTASDKKSYSAQVVITGKSGSNYTGTATSGSISVNLKVKESK
jgi:hypothetical protein